jgi:hypothetical protein
MPTPRDKPPSPWIGFATCAWTAIFAAPHIWWALGSPLAFPGGDANYRLFMSATWRIVYDWVVVFLSLTGFGVALALVRPWGRALPQRPLHAMAWIAFAILTLRGVAGLAVDGLADPIWSPGFLVGGLLFGGVAWRAHRYRQGSTAGLGI